MSDIDENPDQAATEIYYPDSGTGPVQSGLPGQPTARPSGYSNSTADTGVQGGVTPTDIPSGDPGRKTLGDWLHKHTKHNITPVPGEGTSGDATPAESPYSQGFEDPSLVHTVYTDGDMGEFGTAPSKPEQSFGPGGSANTELRDVTGTAQNGTYDSPADGDEKQPQLSGVLTRNRFRPGRAFSADSNWANPQRFERTGGEVQAASLLGKYDPDEAFDGLAVEELTLIAEQLLLNAVGDSSTGFGDKDASTTNFGSGDGLVKSQLGGRKGGVLADTENAFRAATAVASAVKGTRQDLINVQGPMSMRAPFRNESREKASYGVLNNHLEMFGSAFPTSMILLAVTAALAMLIATLVIAAVLDLLGVIASLFRGDGVGGGLNPKATYLVYGGDGAPNREITSLPMGQAYGRDDFSNDGFFAGLYKYMGIPTLDGDYPIGIPFLSATLIGCLEFFIGNALNGGRKVGIPQITTNSAGYYVVVVRNAIRDAEQISEASKEMGGSVTGAIEGFFNLIDAFRSSATFRFAMVMVQIGDRVRVGPGLLGNRDNGGAYGLPQNLSDRLGTPVVASLHSSVRMTQASPRLTYSITALPHLGLRPGEAHFLPTPGPNGELALPRLSQTLSQEAHSAGVGGIPDGVRVEDVLGGFNEKVLPTDIITSKGVAFAQDGELKDFSNRLSYFENGKIPTALRQAIEAELDTYYVPFYFHDLRTNEIVPLPVFVDSISDSFTPKWQEVDGFGRADPVQIYGGTSRKIGFSFYMVATSVADYSALYYAINRLVAMVYPQWSDGEMITNARGQSFTMPYSSVPTASPLVRIRLGELFASNRAPENVRRLFGANKQEFELNAGDDPDNDPPKPSQLEPDGTIPADETPDFEALMQVMENGKSGLASADTAPLYIEATQLINLGGKAELINYAACDFQGKNGNVTDTESKPMLLPPGIFFQCLGGRYRWAQWGGLSYNILKGRRYRCKDAEQFEIINYYVDGKDDDGSGRLTSTIYYFCRPVSDRALAHYNEVAADAADRASTSNPLGEVGIMIPITQLTTLSVPSVLPTPIPNPFAPEPEPLVTDKAFFAQNLLIDAMEESGGYGLAGAITSLDFAWNEAPWELDADLGRAPKYVKVTLSFSPIHDEPLGLTADGALRSAAYPVGKTVEALMGPRFNLPGRDPRVPARDAVSARLAEVMDVLTQPSGESNASID